MPERIRMSRNGPWRDEHPDAVRVDRGRFASPFRLRTREALARVPAVHTPDRDWEYESRISADGMQHDYFHPGGKVTQCVVRYLTAAEVVECYRAYVTTGGWPLDGFNRPTASAPTVAEIRAELAGRDLACWCPLDRPCHADVLLEIANGEADHG